MKPASLLPGVVAVILAAALWGSTGTIQALLPPTRDPIAVGVLRLLIGALSLFALAMAGARSRRGFMGLPWGWVSAAGLAIGLYNLVFFWAVAEAGVGIGTAIAIGSAPIWATGIEVATRGLWPTGLRLMGQICAVIGVALLAMAGAQAESSLLGIALAALAGAAYAAYSLATSAIGGRAPAATIAAATFGCAALFTLPLLAVRPLGWLAGPESWAAMLFLGVAATGLAYALYTWGLRLIPASTAVTLALAEPVTAWLLATTVVGEPLSLQKLIGAALVLAGLALVTLAMTRRA